MAHATEVLEVVVALEEQRDVTVDLLGLSWSVTFYACERVWVRVCVLLTSTGRSSKGFVAPVLELIMLADLFFLLVIAPNPGPGPGPGPGLGVDSEVVTADRQQAEGRTER